MDIEIGPTPGDAVRTGYDNFLSNQKEKGGGKKKRCFLISPKLQKKKFVHVDFSLKEIQPWGTETGGRKKSKSLK